MARKILAAYLLVAAGAACSPRGDSGDTHSTEGGRRGDERERPVVLFLGTSLTAGYGLERDQAYPALIQDFVDSAGYGFRVVNGGESGATSAGGVRRIGWLLRNLPVAVLVIELGANDGLRGYDPAITKANLESIVDSAKLLRPDAAIVVAGMEAPPNLGSEYTARFRRVYEEFARERGANLIPFVLEGVAGVAGLNQSDGIHPTPAGQRVVAENVWRVLRTVLDSLDRDTASGSPGTRRGSEEGS